MAEYVAYATPPDLDRVLELQLDLDESLCSRCHKGVGFSSHDWPMRGNHWRPVWVDQGRTYIDHLCPDCADHCGLRE